MVVLDADRHEHELQAIIDTGFTGFLTLPTTLIERLGLPWRARTRAILGDGTVQWFDLYGATVLWDEEIRTVETDAAEVEPLVGMAMLRGHVVEIHVTDGGPVRIEALH